MRTRDINLLILVILITALAAWVDLSPRADAKSETDRRELWLGRDVHTRLGLDLRGGTQILLQATDAKISQQQLDTARQTIERRVNGLGVAEATVQTSGNNRIIVELPDITDATQALTTIRSTGKLEFVDPGTNQIADGQTVRTAGSPNPRIAAPASASGTITGTQALSQTAAVSQTLTTGPILPLVADGAELDLASVQTGVGQTGEPFVAFKFTGDSATKLQTFSAQHVGKPMAIVLDNKVQSVATIRDTLPGSGQISTRSVTDRDAIYNVLKYGSLPVSFDVQSSRTVSPTLGSRSIRSSTIAGVAGLASVALFMLVYYRLPGLLADGALLIYTVITFALYRLIPITLTLAGIAGFILSIGLAVDANVLIFSRIKDELRRGLPLVTAVERGFDHAWPSIRDANASTLITSLILYWVGSNYGVSIIKGFALTLALGIVISLFTAVAITRTFLRLVVGSGRFRDRWLYAVGAEQPMASSGQPLVEA
ncbi:MAG: protein translocase subunit SecD [Herpetosiphon sp.]